MKLPYLKIKQKGETFFVVKFKASYLKEHVDFHFRDPYKKSKSEFLKFEDYLQQLEKEGLELKSSEKGIQRRLQVKRIKEIKKYLSSKANNFLPNSILLSADSEQFKTFNDNYLKYESSEFGELDLPDDAIFRIIDGQHRLGGLFISNTETIEDFEIPAILLLNTSLPTEAKLFSDINGKQKAVNKSLIYDLYSEMEKNDIENIKKFHIIATKFYNDINSPLYKQIKMLGIGRGAISQAFFIDSVKDAISKTNLLNANTQEIYDHLFLYFKSFQKVFEADWPVPLENKSEEELEKYADKVLKEKKSQLVKTNGFGAILKLFPHIYKKINNKDFKNYFEKISKLKGNISWIPDKTKVDGTGKKFQNSIYEKMYKIIFK